MTGDTDLFARLTAGHLRIDPRQQVRGQWRAELLGGDDAYDPTKPEIIKGTLEDIKELLVNRLLTTEKRA